MKITVFGASGRVGRLVVAELLRRGHQVTAAVHSHSLPAAEGLRIVSCDIYQSADIAAAIAGSEAVVSALGSWGTPGKNVLSTAMQSLVPATQSAGISRLVSVTGSGAAAPGDRPSLSRSLSTALLNTVAPRILRDGQDHIVLLADSRLDWTVVRSPVMVDGNNDYRLSTDFGGLTIARQAVALALADLVTSADWNRQAPYIRK